MPTKNPRLNVVVDNELYKHLIVVAKNRAMSISLCARDLLKEALEIYEDVSWGSLAEKRAKKYKKSNYISHDEAWK